MPSSTQARIVLRPVHTKGEKSHSELARSRLPPCTAWPHGHYAEYTMHAQRDENSTCMSMAVFSGVRTVVDEMYSVKPTALLKTSLYSIWFKMLLKSSPVGLPSEPTTSFLVKYPVLSSYKDKPMKSLTRTGRDAEQKERTSGIRWRFPSTIFRMGRIMPGILAQSCKMPLSSSTMQVILLLNHRNRRRIRPGI